MKVKFNSIAVGPVFRAFPGEVKDISEADAEAFTAAGAAVYVDSPVAKPEPATVEKGPKKK